MIENLFLCVGAQKSGTTWLFDQLKDHPDIGFAPPARKEIQYFNNKYMGVNHIARSKASRLERLIQSDPHMIEQYFADYCLGKVDENSHVGRLLSPPCDEWYVKQFSENRKNMRRILRLNTLSCRRQGMKI